MFTPTEQDFQREGNLFLLTYFSTVMRIVGVLRMIAWKQLNKTVHWVARSLLVLLKAVCPRVLQDSSLVVLICNVIGTGESPRYLDTVEMVCCCVSYVLLVLTSYRGRNCAVMSVAIFYFKIRIKIKCNF